MARFNKINIEVDHALHLVSSPILVISSIPYKFWANAKLPYLDWKSANLPKTPA